MLIYIFILISLSFSFDVDSQVFDRWGGYSVSSSDNMDAFTYNPAGFGIDHGRQVGWYISPADTSFVYGVKMYGFGYSVHYHEGDELFNASDVNIAFASKVNSTTSFGANWSKLNKEIVVGLLVRPVNFLSLGYTTNFTEDLKKNLSSRVGLGIRPFNNDRLTMGIDLIRDEDESNVYSPFIDFSIFSGISIRNQIYINDFDELNSASHINILTSLNLNFGKSTAYISESSKSTNNGYGFGFIETAHKKTTIFNKPSKDKQKFIRFKLDGLYIEEKSEKTPFGFNPVSLFSNQEKGKQLRRWINEINKFTKDESVAGFIIDMGSVRAGFSKKQEMYNALKRFKDSGKKIIIYAEYGIANTDYYLISMADEIYINDMTGINLRGLSMEVSFYKQFLDTLNIVPEVFRVNIDGDSYKTAGDPFLEKTATEQMKENYGELLKDLYSIFVEGISEGRSWSKNRTTDIIDNGPYGISSKIIENGLITNIMYPDEFETYLEETIGNDKKDDDKKSKKNDKPKYQIVKWKEIDRSKEYVSDWKRKEKNNIALIYAVGAIMPGESKKGPGGSTVMGDKTINKAIKSAREDDSIDAIVLRIDSGGGSALASDQMWREIELTTNNSDTTKNKPFIASMSDVAASGGYYIACNADKIMASESSITGSIGVIGLNINMSKFWKQFGINPELVVKEGEHADFHTGSRLRNSYETEKMEEWIEDIYNTFKKRVLDGREGLDDINKLDDIAMGRVWTGTKAKEHNLVDELGGLNDAILLAAKEAGIENDDNLNIIEYPKKNIASKIKNISKNKNNLLLDSIPSDILDEYIEIINLIEMSESGAIMIIPAKIEVN